MKYSVGNRRLVLGLGLNPFVNFIVLLVVRRSGTGEDRCRGVYAFLSSLPRGARWASTHRCSQAAYCKDNTYRMPAMFPAARRVSSHRKTALRRRSHRGSLRHLRRLLLARTKVGNRLGSQARGIKNP